MDTKKIIIVTAIIIAVFFLSKLLFSVSNSAPLFDGFYLEYKTEDEVSTIISFEKISDDQFRVVTKSKLPSSEFPEVINNDKETIVNKKLKNKNGSIFEYLPLGPIWISPGSIKKGGSVRGGDKIDEIKKWNKWEVGVVNANFAGALSGTWYYDKKTGFLVGMKRDTAFLGSEESILEDTNLKELLS